MCKWWLPSFYRHQTISWWEHDEGVWNVGQTAYPMI